MELRIGKGDEIVLWLGADDQVQVSMDINERAQCRELLESALDLLNQTVVNWSTFSTATETDVGERQSPPHHVDCLAVYDCSHPSKPRAGTAALSLRIVSTDHK